MKSSNGVKDLQSAVNTAIQETERYYREQIFSSGCSSLVPIFRIGDHTNSPEALLKQLNGSPYIQRDVSFSEKIVETLLDINLYRFEQWHFFFQGDMNGALADFVSENCTQISSLSEVLNLEAVDQDKQWQAVHAQLHELCLRFPVLSSLNLSALQTQIDELLRDVQINPALNAYIDILQKPEWIGKFRVNQGSMLCMLALANTLGLPKEAQRNLLLLAMLKDLGYTRLSEKIAEFEVLHPLVSHQLVKELNDHCDNDSHRLSDELIDAILVHHEFNDHSGPLARMKHPQVKKILEQKLPVIAQISGLCDLYFGFLDKYSPGLAYSITRGFVLGHGDTPPRYDRAIVDAFTEVLRKGSYANSQDEEKEAEDLINSILNLLKHPDVRKNANNVILGKSHSWHDRITVTVNLIRNIAQRQPTHLNEATLVGALSLPIEFGLEY